MQKRCSPLHSNRYFHSVNFALLTALTTGCADEAPGAVVDATSDAAASLPDASPSSSETNLFGNNPPPTPPITTSSAPSYDGTHENAPIQACEDAVGGSGTPLIDDFEDGDQAIIDDDGRGGTWYFYDDMTQGERKDAAVADPLGERSGKVLEVTGSGFSDWGSGFGAGLHWNTGQCTYDASSYDGVEFWIRGMGTTRVTLQNLSVRPIDLGGECPTDAACFDSHGVNLTLNDAWTLVHLPFSAFEQAGWGTPVGPLRTNAVYLLEFQFGTIQPYSVWLDDVTFFRETETTDAGTTNSSSAATTLDEISSVTDNPTDSTAASETLTAQTTSEHATASEATTSEALSSETTPIDALDAGTAGASPETTTVSDASSSDLTVAAPTRTSAGPADAGNLLGTSLTP